MSNNKTLRTIGIICLIVILLILVVIIYRYLEYDRVSDSAYVHRAKCETMYPCSIEELQGILNDNIQSGWPKPICIAGGKYSQGGHTMLDGAIQLDLAKLNWTLFVNESNSDFIKVGAGATWKDVIKFLDRFDRSVLEMQSYWNFSVGGSISVNCHGRGMNYGTLADTIDNLEILVYDRSIDSYKLVQVRPDDELFQAVVGGYGAIAIIVTATLITTKNVPIMRFVNMGKTNDYLQGLKEVMKYQPLMYNAEIYPEAYNKVHHIYWLPDFGDPIEYQKLRPSGGINYRLPVIATQLIKSFRPIAKLRAKYETKANQKLVSVWRNYEMSHDVDRITPLTKKFTTYILQEYFVPTESSIDFVHDMIDILVTHDVNILNLSLRVVKPTERMLLNYSQVSTSHLESVESSLTIAVVLYINIRNTLTGLDQTRYWARMIIDKVLEYGGRYYLPYLPLATRSQFEQAYPEASEFRRLKQKYDSKDVLQSQFINYYIRD